MAKYATRSDVASMRGQRTDPWYGDIKYVRKNEVTGLSGIIYTSIASRPDNSLVPLDKISYKQPLGNLIMVASSGEYGSFTSGAFALDSFPDTYDQWDGNTYIGGMYRESDTRYQVQMEKFSTWGAGTSAGQYVVITDWDDDEHYYRFWNYQLTNYDIQRLDSGYDVEVSAGWKYVLMD